MLVGWFLMVSMSPESSYSERHWLVTSNSLLKISGTTNVNTFSCLSVSYSGQDIMTERFHVESQEGNINGKIIMQANGFDCENYIMNRDFKKTISADEYPDIEVSFISLPNNYAIENDQNSISGKGEVEIKLAGVSRKYNLSYIIRKESDGSKILLGNRSFRFSDFGLETPQKFFGMVSVNDEVSVDFSLKLEPLENK